MNGETKRNKNEVTLMEQKLSWVHGNSTKSRRLVVSVVYFMDVDVQPFCMGESMEIVCQTIYINIQCRYGRQEV